MSSIINTNLGSLNAQRNLSKSENRLSVSLQRLSSGLRINSAKDDAAGLAIGERMTSQINGQSVAIRNTNDGISLTQTAEGSMHELNGMLQRVRELAVQASNGIYTQSDRQAMSVEKDQLLEAFNQMSKQSSFNGMALLDGTFVNKGIQVGADAGETIPVSLPELSISKTVQTITKETVTSLTMFGSPFSGWISPPRSLEINGKTVAIDQDESAISVANKINSAFPADSDPDLKVTATAVNKVAFGISPVGAQIDMQLVAGENYGNGASFSFVYADTVAGNQALMDDINSKTAQTGVRAVDLLPNAVPITFSLETANGETLHVVNNSDPSVVLAIQKDRFDPSQGVRWDTGHSGAGQFGNSDFFAYGTLHLEANRIDSLTPDGIVDMFGDLYGFIPPNASKSSFSISKSLFDVSFDTQAKSMASIEVLDAALTKVSSAMAEVGAYQNRFESVIENLQSSTEQLSASRSRIMDADYAAETAELTRNQILQQAGTAMLAQANKTPEQVLSLLK